MLDMSFARRLFAAEWYASGHPEAAADPFRHFIEIGMEAGFDPNPLFDTAWYASRYQEAIPVGESPFKNYLREGARLGRDPGPLFDTDWYLAKNPDVAAAGANPFEHYLIYGSHENRDPSPLFDSGWYFATYPGAARAPGVDACAHYMMQGHKLGYAPNPLFDTQWYRAAYPEAAAEVQNPLLHFVLRGAAKGYNPGPNFDTSIYVEHHPGCLEARKNPLVHLLLEEEVRRQAALRRENDGPLRPSPGAVREIDALVDLLGELESELKKIDGQAGSAIVQTGNLDGVEAVWRELYLSLFMLPKRILIVGSIDQTPELASVAKDAADLLIIETDTQKPSVAEGLPRGTQWRSLSEFGYLSKTAGRVALMTALVNNLQPHAVMVWGSQAGWEMLASHGRTLHLNSRLFAVAYPLAQAHTPDPVKLHFVSCIPFLSALYGSVAHPVEQLGSLFGLPHSERGKLQHVGDWSLPGGFLQSEARS